MNIREWLRRWLRPEVHQVSTIGIVRLMREQEKRGEWSPSHKYPTKKPEPASLREMVEEEKP